MVKYLFLLVIIVSIFSKIELLSAIITFDVDQPFDINNHLFNFTNEAKDTALFLLKFITEGEASFTCSCPGMYMAHSLLYEEEDVLINVKPGECRIEINANSASGILNIHPFNKEIKADLENKKYRLNNMIYYNEEFPPLIYSISDLNKDIEVEFYYKPIKIESGDKNYILKNPFEICPENEESDCKKNISEYTFIKGKN